MWKVFRETSNLCLPRVDYLSGDDVADHSFHRLDFAQTQGGCPPAVSPVTHLCSVSVQQAAARFSHSSAWNQPNCFPLKAWSPSEQSASAFRKCLVDSNRFIFFMLFICDQNTTIIWVGKLFSDFPRLEYNVFPTEKRKLCEKTISKVIFDLYINWPNRFRLLFMVKISYNTENRNLNNLL